MRSGPWAVCLAAVVIDSGCFGSGGAGADDGVGGPGISSGADALMDRTFSLASMEPFEATSFDGTRLRGHVYLPDAEPPFPVILEMSPYFNTGEYRSDGFATEMDGRTTLDVLHHAYLDAGFAFAFVSVRGSGTSQGCFQFGGEEDWGDIHAVVETLAEMPWSNGNVGMWGLSYAGWTQYMALADPPPSLKAIVPISGVIDYWSLITRNGAPIGDTPTLQAKWTAHSSTGTFHYGALIWLLGYSNGPHNVIPEPPDPSHFPCPEYVYDTPPNLELAWTGDRGPYFDERDYREAIGASGVAVFFTNGLTNGEGHILQFEGLWDLLPEGKRRMMLGQWGHDYPSFHREDFDRLAVGFYHEFLRNGSRVTDLDVVEYQDRQGEWHTTTQWPPASNRTVLHLSDGTMVASLEDVVASSQSFQSVPNFDPDPRYCGPVQTLWVSPPLAEDIHLAGSFWANVTLTSNLPGGNIGAFLFHTAGDGSCGPSASAQEVRRALSDLRHWERAGMGQDFPTGIPTLVPLDSLPFATNVPAGNRLVLAVAGGISELTPDARLPEVTATTGPRVVGVVDLPVVSGTLRFA